MYSVIDFSAFIFNIFCCAIQNMFLQSGTSLQSANLLSGTKFLQRGLGNCAVRCQVEIGCGAEKVKANNDNLSSKTAQNVFRVALIKFCKRARKTSGTGFRELSQVRSLGNLQSAMSGILQRGMFETSEGRQSAHTC